MRFTLAASALAVLVFAPDAGAWTYDPPSWFNEGRSEVAKRGGKCETSKQDVNGEGVMWMNPATGQLEPRGNYTEEGVNCPHSVPAATYKGIFGVSPYGTTVGEGCSALWQYGGNDALNEYSYACSLYTNPGTSRAPNMASWSCGRQAYGNSFGETTNQGRWRAEKTRLWPARKAKSLSGCMAPRARVFDGTGLAITCSHACTVKAGRVEKKLKAGRKTPIPLATTGSIPLSIAATGYRAHATINATRTGSKLTTSAPDVLTLKK
jgi:hypothetical protein